jgi:thiosulfate/3-mercaptopyruvate sulfurtransferase
MTKFNINILGILILSLIAFAPVVDAGCCSGGTWDPSGFLNSELDTGQPVQSTTSEDSATADPIGSAKEPIERSATYPNGVILKPMKSVSSSDVVIDVSNDDSYAASHIKDAIHIPGRDLLSSEGNLKTAEDLAGLLGQAGISNGDSVVLYAGQESSGQAQFAFFVLNYLGQKEVKILDGSLADWKAAGLPEDVLEKSKPAVEYSPQVRSEVMAEYDYVKSGQAQIIDVRPFVDFGKGRIPGSIALDPANVVKGDKIRDVGGLTTVFSRLDKEKPIVVYSDDYSRSALVAYALQLMGYQASIYSWEDWKAHEAAQAGNETAPTVEDPVDSKYTKLGST